MKALKASNALFGDPVHNVVKMLFVDLAEPVQGLEAELEAANARIAAHEAGLKDSVAERPNHSNFCRSAFAQNSIRIQENV